MPIDLAKAVGGGGGGVPIGGEVMLAHQRSYLSEVDGQVFLRAGVLLTAEQGSYPDAYAKLSTPANAWKVKVTLPTEFSLFGLAASPTTLYALGRESYYQGYRTYGYSSADGVTWAASPLSLHPGVGKCFYIEGAAYIVSNSSGGTPIILRNTTGSWGSVFNSPDLTNAVNHSLAYIPGKMAALFSTSNDYGKLCTSTDGVSWTSGSLGYGRGFLCSDGSKFLMVGITTNSKISTSTDGVNWTVSTAVLPAGLAITSFQHINGTYLLTTLKGLLYSTDAINWSRSIEDPAVFGGTFFDGYWVFYRTGGVSASMDLSELPVINDTLVGSPVVFKGKLVSVHGYRFFESVPNCIGLQEAYSIKGMHRYMRIK